MDPVPRIRSTAGRPYNYADYHQSRLLFDNERMYLPIKIESVIPHDIAGTDAPLYNALGPCLFSSLLHRASLGGHLPRF
jgi:hypothetical protein